MARAEDIARREPQPQPHPQHISMQVTDFPRDLLQRFINGDQLAYKNNLQNREETEEIELSLGLSLNGRFGVDPKRASKLSRSSSIPDFLNPFAKDNNNNDTPFMVPMACANLIRTCSLPTETEDDWRRRKELQTLRRMEAKRKRSEKQRNLKISRELSRVFAEENIGEDDKKEERDGTGNGIYQVENCVSFGVPTRVNGGKGPCGIAVKGGAAVDGDLPPVAPSAVAASQGSIGSSQGSGSSGFSEFDNQQPQGLNKYTEAVSPSSVQSTLKSEQKSPTNPEATIAERSGKIVRVPVKSESSKVAIAEKKVKEVVRNVLEDMPCVSTKGDGPNGKRIEGFLYRYRKGEEVRIVCVCHGSFLTPAEFVKHAGGGDVTHPLKHIVVNPSSLL